MTGVADVGIAHRNKRTGEVVWVYHPTPKQRQFHLDPAPNKLYGGAAGGGKSHALRFDAYMACLAQPTIACLLLRRTYPELESTHLERVMLEADLVGATYVKTDHILRFPNGATLRFGHCQDDQAVARYLSTEYDRIYFDELVTFSEKQFLMISSRARSTIPGMVPVVLAGTNPGGPGAHWIKRRFIDKNLTQDDDPSYRPEDFSYIPALLDDNPHVDPRYEQRLMSLPKDLRDAYRYGDWNIFPGQFFGEFRKNEHVSLLNVPNHLPRLRAIDWGYVKPGVCLWAVLHDGHLVIEKEWVFERLIASDVAAQIDRMTKDMGWKIRSTVADTGMWSPDTQTGETLAETFGRYGVPLVQADKDRINGWARVRAWLRPAPDGRPWMQISPDCAYLVRTLPALVSDAHRPEDVDSDGEDHAADALRYLVMSRPSPLGAKAPADFPKGSMGWHKQRLLGRRPVILGRESVKR